MISQLNGSAVKAAYTNSSTENREVSKKPTTNISSQGDLNKVDQIKEAMASGEYKIDLQALSEKIADELL